MKLHLPLLLRAAVLACIAAFPAVATAAEGSTMHLYILTGQSNSLGSVKGSPATPEQLAQYASAGQLWNGNMNQSTGALYESQPTWTTVAPQLPSYNGNNCMGPEYGFSYMMLHKGWIDAAAGDGMGVIKASLDGGGNHCWVKGSNAYNSILSSVKNAINEMRESGAYANISLEGLLYQQGESNSADEAAVAQTRYLEFLRNLKADLEAAGYDSSLLVQSVLGEPATWDNPDHAASTTNSTATAVQLKALADSSDDIGWVRTRDLSKITSGDSMGVHYDGKSQITIGARYAYAMALQQGKDVGAVRNDNYTTGVSLNNGAAWWNGTAPTANEVVVWDVSSANVADTLSGDLSVKGIVIEDPFRDRISIAAAGDATLSLGSSGITLQKAGLDIGVNLTTTADQIWQVAGGQTLSVGSSDHAVALGGGHTISLRSQGEGTATVSLHTQESTNGQAWDVGTGVNLLLSGSHDSVQLADSATASLSSSSGGSLELTSLTLGDNSTLSIGGIGSTCNMSIGSLTLGSGCVLDMDILTNSAYDSLSLSQITGDNVSFQFHYGLALTPNKSYTIVQGWNDALSFDFNEDAGNNRTASLAVIDGNLVLTILGEGIDYTRPWVAPAEGTPTQTITATGDYNATATATSTLTNGTTVSNVQFFAHSGNATGDFYGELRDTAVNWVSAYGAGRGSDACTLEGNAHAKVSGEATVTINAIYGVVNGTLRAGETGDGGNAYVELNNPNATYGSINGAYNSNVDGSVTFVVRGGTVNGAVTGGSVNSNRTIGGGTYLQLEGGTYKGIIRGGSSVASTINGGSHVYIKGGTFNGMVTAGNNGNKTGSVINDGASMAIYGGTFKNWVVAGGFGGTVNGGVELTIAGGDFSALVTNNQGIYAGGGSRDSVINGGTTTTLLGIDDSNKFALYTGILSGGNQATSASLSGDKILKLEGYTVSQVNAQLQDFGSITVTQGSSTRISNSNNSTLGGATALNVDGDSTLELSAEGSAWDLSNTGATVAAGSTLSKGGAEQLTLHSLSGGGDFVVEEGTAVLNSVADFEGTINVSADATTQAVAGSSESVTYEVAAGGTAQITAAAGNLGTLKGSGLVKMTGAGGTGTTAFTMMEGVWTGTVKFDASRTNMADIDLALYGVKGSTIAFQGAGTHASGYSYLKNAQTVKSNLLLEADAHGIGLKLTAGSSTTTVTFEGAWTGNGKFLFDNSSTNVTETFAFTNDLTGFEGGIEANTGLTLRFGNGAIMGTAVGSATGIGTIEGLYTNTTDPDEYRKRTVKVVINYLDDTISQNSFAGNLNLTKEGTATHTLTAANSYTGTTTVSGGTLALQENGSLGSGVVTIATTAKGLAWGASLLASAKDGSNGTIREHSSITATTLAGTESRHATLNNLTLSVLPTLTRAAGGDTVLLQYADLQNSSILAGQGACMALDKVSFDTVSSARLAEDADACNITATDVTIALSEDEFSLSPESGETNILTLTSDRFSALTFSDTVTLSDDGDYLAGLLDAHTDLHKIIISFDGADMSKVTDVQLNLPGGASPYTLSLTDGKLVLTSDLGGAKWTSQDDLWSDDAADWNQADAPSASRAANLTGLGSSTIRIEGNKEAQALNVNTYDTTESTGTHSYTLAGDALAVGSMRVAYGSLEIQNAVTAEAREAADGWTGTVTVAAQGSLTVGEGASLTAAEMTVNRAGGEKFTNKGETVISGCLTAGDIVNDGRLSIGDSSDVEGIAGSGSLETHGAVSLGSLGNSSLNVADGTTVLKAATTTLSSLTGDGTLSISPAPGESGSLVMAEGADLSIGGLSVASLTLQGSGQLGSIGTLAADSLTLSGTSLDDLKTGNGVLTVTSLSALAADGTMTLSLDSLNLKDMVLGTAYTVFSGGGDCASHLSLSADMRTAAQRLGWLLSLSAGDEGDLILTATVLPEDVWFTDESTTAHGTAIASDYTVLDEVGDVYIAGTTGRIDLGPASLDDATDPTLGLTVKNLQGDDQNGVLTLSGGADDLVTLMNAADTATAGTLVLDGLRAYTASRDGGSHSLGIAAVELKNNAALHAEDDAIDLSVGQLNGNSGTVSGAIRITGKGGNYSGQYEGNARLVLEKSAEQTLMPGKGLSLEALSGSSAILAEATKGKEMERLSAERGSVVDLGEAAAGDKGLTLNQGGSIGGELAFRMAAGDAGKGVIAIAGNNASYGKGASILITQTEAEGTLAISVAPTAATGMVLAQVGADNNSTATVTLNGSLFRKYFDNARLSGNAVVVDRNTHYASDLVTPDSSNGHAGAALLDDLLVTLNPQANAAASPDLAALMDALDQGLIRDTQAAAAAGASIAALGNAFMGDMERQLRAIRNRTTNMGLDQSQGYDDLPYLNAWINAEGDYRKLEQDGTAAGYTLNSWGGTVGFDLDVTPALVAGFAVTAMYGDINANAPDIAEGDFDSYYVSLFARYASRAWTHTFVGSLGWADISLDRKVSYGSGNYQATGDTEGLGFGLMYEVGYVLPLDEDATTCLQPVFNVSWRHIGINSYTEYGTDAALRADEQTMDVVTFGVGARLQSALPENIYNRTALFEARALLKADAGDRSSGLCVSLNRGAKTVGIESAEVGAVGVELGAGLTIPVEAEGGALFIDGSAECRQGYTNLNGTVGYRINF